MAAPNPQRQREERERLAKLFANPAVAYVIHYACQSFSAPDNPASPRIAAIAVRNLATGATESFSIHQELERAKRPLSLDQCERQMLDHYFDFLEAHRGMTFLHWKMRDVKFGFAALEHRYEVLGGKPFALSDHQKLDLSLMLANLYGTGYLPTPHFEAIAKRNGLSLMDYMAGPQEPEAFRQGRYKAVLLSALCKVALIAGTAQLAADGTLKTNANWWTLNSGRLREAVELFDRNPVSAWAGLIASALSVGFGLVFKYF
jgi:hypothetical protein